MKKSIVILLAVMLSMTMGLLEVLDHPEDLERAVQSHHLFEIDGTVIMPEMINLANLGNRGLMTSDSRKAKSDYFDEDYVINWLPSARLRFAILKDRLTDTSSIKYKAYFSLGHLVPRHILLTLYREYIDLFNQQYGRSIH
ncbi:MAG TPA: hypothetical protein VGK02_00425 [Candidatus Aquicultor sp.]